jgi:GSCFA family
MPIKSVAKANPAWKRFLVDHAVTAAPHPLVTSNDTFFLMGSCFAEEIRLALERILGPGKVVPNYRLVQFDKATAKVDELPERNHLNTYNAFSVLQEIERILGLWHPEPDDYWHTDGRLQCPYRRLVFADTPDIFALVSAQLDRSLRVGFAAADHFIFTFGMTEVFLNRASGKVANQKPGYGRGGGEEETTYHRAGFAENVAAITRTVDLITTAKPNARIFCTVSPVPLRRTFSGEDIYVANSLSKSTLRTVLAEVAATRPNVTYFPSYEAVISGGDAAWEKDGRHVQRDVVEAITQTFVKTYFAP